MVGGDEQPRVLNIKQHTPQFSKNSPYKENNIVLEQNVYYQEEQSLDPNSPTKIRRMDSSMTQSKLSMSCLDTPT